MYPRHASRVVGALTVLTALLVFGCSGETKSNDPYAEVSLRQLAYGPAVVSKGFKYKIRNPKIVSAIGHLAMVREGNITEMIAGRSIADKIEGMDFSNIEFNVVKKYTPFTHYRVEQVVSGTDTVFVSQAGSINYPRITPADDFKSREHEDYDLDRLKWNRTEQLRKAKDKQFVVSGTLAIVEEDGDEVWMLTGDESTVRIGPVSEDMAHGIEMICRLLYENNIPFEGGITFIEEEPWPTRRNNQICGDIEIDFVKYMGRVFQG